MDICRLLVMVGRLEGCLRDRSVRGTQMCFVDVMGRSAGRADQNQRHGNDADATNRFHTVISGPTQAQTEDRSLLRSSTGYTVWMRLHMVHAPPHSDAPPRT
jgi:hypothetical protein